MPDMDHRTPLTPHGATPEARRAARRCMAWAALAAHPGDPQRAAQEWAAVCDTLGLTRQAARRQGRCACGRWLTTAGARYGECHICRTRRPRHG